MLIGRSLLIIIIIIFWTFLFGAITSENSDEHHHEQLKLIVVPIQSTALSGYQTECHESCITDYCYQYALLNKNCTKLIRDHCDCCTVCLRKEKDICGGRFNVYGICEQDLVCYKSNKTITTVKNLHEQTGICVKACVKFQCLSVIKNNEKTCECINRRVPCDKNLNYDTRDNCQNQSIFQQEHELSSLKTSDAKDLIDCSKIICNTAPINSSSCPSDSHFIEDHTSLLGTSSLALSKTNISSICCEPRGQCICSSCPKTICGENSIMQIYRIGSPYIPGQCCDKFNCITNSEQCYHDKKIYNENETWSIDQCTTCTCRAGRVDCAMIQCPTYTHCGYMYKPENECCPKCGGCLNDRLNVQHMNSTWIESDGCMRCWCENGRSRCLAEGCIAPPCENPRQIANVCCPVCDYEDQNNFEKNLSIIQPISKTSIYKCPKLDNCLLVCEHGLTKDEHGCFQCACSTMSCPTPLCTIKFEKVSKQYCLCSSPPGLNCGELHCDKHCPYSYSINEQTGCPYCACNPCPQLSCTKNCTYGLKKNEVGCPICVCKSNLTSTTALVVHSWPRQCQSGLFSYSNGEIWFDGCRQCLCHKGEQLCALISCPAPKCSQPIFLPNRCCPSCPDPGLLPEPTPSSQVCYASQYVTGEELEFDKCTKCMCLHNIAFCSISLCPPLSCSSPIYDSSLCCPICPPSSSESLSIIDNKLNIDDDVCILDNGMIKNAGELWTNNDCQSCLCPRGGNGQIECFSQTCKQDLPCSNPILKKGQCCPFCLPPTAAVAVCIFNFIQYRSGEHWNVSECHHCECLLGTIVCHQSKCPQLTCTQTVTLSGHCCPICRDQLSFFNNQDKLQISSSRVGFSISIVLLIISFIIILVIIIIILIYFLLHGKYRSSSSSLNQISNRHHHRSPKLAHQKNIINSKSSHLSPYQYDLILMPNDMNNTKGILSSSSNNPLTSLERISSHSIIGTNTTGTSSSNTELEPIIWNEDDTIMIHGSTSSNDDDYDHETISTDNEKSHRQYQMINGPPTIIYV
ncbi:unnamed protein product [Adineta steineri]|uniref:Uncharacterized protein n=1 Tax=Adineta steineri TaxID=433720 RepID=A0A819AA60_9BILA|nr:unnamed protein product [Adineta steineri]